MGAVCFELEGFGVEIRGVLMVEGWGKEGWKRREEMLWRSPIVELWWPCCGGGWDSAGSGGRRPQKDRKRQVELHVRRLRVQQRYLIRQAKSLRPKRGFDKLRILLYCDVHHMSFKLQE